MRQVTQGEVDAAVKAARDMGIENPSENVVKMLIRQERQRESVRNWHSSEKGKAAQKRYHSTPEAKARRAAYNQQEDVKERQRRYHKERYYNERALLKAARDAGIDA